MSAAAKMSAARKAELLHRRNPDALGVARRALGNHVARATVNHERVEFWREVIRLLEGLKAKVAWDRVAILRVDPDGRYLCTVGGRVLRGSAQHVLSRAVSRGATHVERGDGAGAVPMGTPAIGPVASTVRPGRVSRLDPRHPANR